MRSAWVLGMLLIVQGCASQGVSIRSLPPEDPAAVNAAAVQSAAAFAAATKAEAESKADAAAGDTGPVGPNAPETLPPVTPADAPSMYTYDPWERINRFTYRFN